MEKVDWPEGGNISQMARKYYEQEGTLPDSWAYNQEKLVANDFKMGFYQLHRWKYDGWTRVTTGAALELVLHPTEPRCLTHREVARAQGFPDDWLIEPLSHISNLRQTWGKGIPVPVGKWIGEQISNSLDGNPGEDQGELIGDREYMIDVTNAYKEAESYPDIRPKKVKAA
jgi:site-specific DNA-cytosine methylase